MRVNSQNLRAEQKILEAFQSFVQKQNNTEKKSISVFRSENTTAQKRSTKSSRRISGQMQGGGNIFTGVDLRRPRGFPSTASPASQPPLNCPRCDSTNTKFCYYNNYNLSQPRHFCKACRRYWTKGGVLRNVPVGGGCRKAKRSSAAKSSNSASTKEKKRTSTCRSSSDTSTITAIDPSNLNPSPPNALFVETCGVLEFSFPDPLNISFGNDSSKEILEMEPDELPPSVLDQTAAVDFQAITGLDWPASMESNLVDLSSAVDSVSYWNPSRWSDTMADPSSLYLP
ncbi:hypothetical protein LUZ60_003256 [Juncus effusus]|nr:hypothetical protein LUZ60_003256 [Juncus effusus]